MLTSQKRQTNLCYIFESGSVHKEALILDIEQIEYSELYIVANISADAAQNETLQVCQKIAQE